MTKEITSATNPFLKHLKALATSKKARRDSGEFIVEGWRGVKTLLERPTDQFSIQHVVISDSWNEAPLPNHLETIRIPDHLFEKISDVRTAQGVLAIVRSNAAAFDIPSIGRFLLLDQLRDPGNLGTLIRSTVGAGFDGVLLYGDCVEPTNPKVIRSTMGAFAFANVQDVSLVELDEMMMSGYELCVTTGLGGENLYETAFGDQTILAIGSEAHGVSDELFAKAAKKITIPLAPECESLNAAIAGSVCMFQIARGVNG